MISFELFHLLKTAAKTLMLAAVFAPFASFTQPTQESLSDQELESLSAQEQRMLEEIEQEISLNGPYSEELIGLFTELSFHYEEIGASVLAEETIHRVLTVIRANNGFDALEQAPVIRRLISRETARGNVAVTWELEHELLRLAARNPDDLRSAEILRETGDKRMDILRRYDAGEFPHEIVLGCFYDDSLVQQQAALRGSQPMTAVRRLGPEAIIERRNCGAGDRSHARRSLAESAQWFYMQSVNLMRRNGASSSNELPEVLTKLVRTSYLFTNPALGAESLRGLLDYATTNSEAWIPQIVAHVHLADWDLLYASDLGTRFEESAAASYEQAYDLLLEQRIAQDTIEEIFSPEMPVVLPSFVANPLVSDETPQSKGYIDVAFVITEEGKSKQIEVLDATADVPRAAERDLVRTIKFSRFRPRVTAGRFADSAPIVVRYYLND